MRYLRFSPVWLAALAAMASLGYSSAVQAASAEEAVKSDVVPTQTDRELSKPISEPKIEPKKIEPKVAEPKALSPKVLSQKKIKPKTALTKAGTQIAAALPEVIVETETSTTGTIGQPASETIPQSQAALLVAQGGIPEQDTPNQIKITPDAPAPTAPQDPTIQVAPQATPQVTPTPSQAPPLPTTGQPPAGQPAAGEQPPEPRVLVAEVQVTGATGNLEDEVYRVIRTRPGQTTTRSQLQEDINAIFATGFFANVQAKPEDTPLGVRVSFDVQPNPTLKGVRIEGSSIVKQADVDKVFQEQYGSTLNYRSLQRGIQDLTKRYQDEGYVLAQVVDLPKVDPDGTVTLQVAEGDIESVRVRFLNKEGEEQLDKNGKPKGRTREFIVLREMETKSGQVFNRKTAERDLQRVFGLGIFEDVKLSLDPGSDPKKAIVNVNVVERNTGSIAAGAGISSASGLFGTVSYQQQNLGGNNQKLGAELQVGQRELLFDASFSDPWIAGDPYRTSYTINGFRRRSISLIFDGGEDEVRILDGSDRDRPRVVRTGGGISFSRPLSKDVFKRSPWSASLGLQYQRVKIQNADGDKVEADTPLVNEAGQTVGFGRDLSFSGEGTDDLLTLQLGFVKDTRNDALKPTRGSVLRFGTEQSIPIGQGSILFNRLRGSYSFYIPTRLTKFTKGCQTKDPKLADCPQAFAFNIQGGTVLGDLPPYEAFSLGGSNSVRGFEEGDVGSGKSFIQASAEYRFPLFSIISGALFVDAATDLGTGDSVKGNPAGLRGKPGSGIGYGLGVRVQSPLGPIRVDYGFNDQGDSRLHFGIGERF
ncbi:BamA/TamA family outer membrane protein [Alkalinema pantanalense CENA528]|uniref:BamA/TamA family outer membrane protein n=1 Tax=Alkalinema pantanalense TaxID=1620705 RepID=UPI003D6F30C3